MFSPVNGGDSEHNSYTRQPSDQMSDFMLYLPPLMTSYNR